MLTRKFPMPEATKMKRMRRETVWRQMLRNDVLGPKAASDTKRMFFAGEEYMRIMSGSSFDPPGVRAASYEPKVEASLNVAKFGNAQINGIDENKERAELLRGLGRWFSQVLECVLLRDMTIAETAQEIESASDERTKERIKERLRSALMHLALSHFKVGSR